MVKRLSRVLLGTMVACLLSACGQVEIPPYLRPLSKDTMMLLGKKGMKVDSPLFVRVFKEESELEVWKQREDGRYYHFKTYPVCNWSGTLGPKLQQGDMQAPEGFYSVPQSQMNPNSQYHLAFNLGYPNAYDRANKRTGDFLMIHGKCKSAGCYAMTDALIEEIYALARESFIGGQDAVRVHAFPFRLTDDNLARHKASPHYRFWLTLKEGYDHFEVSRQVPEIAVCERRYVVAVKPRGGQRVNPEGMCPQFDRLLPEAFVPLPTEQATENIVVQGAKQRTLTADGTLTPAQASVPSGVSGLGLSSSGGSSRKLGDIFNLN